VQGLSVGLAGVARCLLVEFVGERVVQPTVVHVRAHEVDGGLSDNASPSHGLNPTTAEPQSGLFFGKTDDLWSFGKPAGWGGPWWETPVEAGVPSDPYLMTGFDQKCLNVENFADSEITIAVEIDFHGHGRFGAVDSLTVPAHSTVAHVFPPGFSAHWVRLVSDRDTVASAQLFYT